jgi:outer membrane beta-barrel protein
MTTMKPLHVVVAIVGLAAGPTLAQEDELQLDEPTADEPAAAGVDGDADGASDESASGDGAGLAAGDDAGDETPASGKTATDEGIDLTLQDRIKAVSRKTFLKAGRFELQPNVMMTVNDSFFRSFALSGRLAWHLNDAFALEVGGGYIPPFLVQKLDPIDQLREGLALINADNKPFALADVGLTFSPLYGKVALLGDSIINFDGFLSAGVGATFDNGKDVVHPTMDVGVGARVFLTRWLVVRGDLRDYVYPQDKADISTLQNLMFVSLGIGFYFPFDFEYQYEAARVNKNG